MTRFRKSPPYSLWNEAYVMSPDVHNVFPRVMRGDRYWTHLPNDYDDGGTTTVSKIVRIVYGMKVSVRLDSFISKLNQGRPTASPTSVWTTGMPVREQAEHTNTP